jgi:hypothetical protein
MSSRRCKEQYPRCLRKSGFSSAPPDQGPSDTGVIIAAATNRSRGRLSVIGVASGAQRPAGSRARKSVCKDGCIIKGTSLGERRCRRGAKLFWGQAGGQGRASSYRRGRGATS